MEKPEITISGSNLETLRIVKEVAEALAAKVNGRIDEMQDYIRCHEARFEGVTLALRFLTRELGVGAKLLDAEFVAKIKDQAKEIAGINEGAETNSYRENVAMAFDSCFALSVDEPKRLPKFGVIDGGKADKPVD
jgi:hypothetical protein